LDTAATLSDALQEYTNKGKQYYRSADEITDLQQQLESKNKRCKRVACVESSLIGKIAEFTRCGWVSKGCRRDEEEERTDRLVSLHRTVDGCSELRQEQKPHYKSQTGGEVEDRHGVSTAVGPKGKRLDCGTLGGKQNEISLRLLQWARDKKRFGAEQAGGEELLQETDRLEKNTSEWERNQTDFKRNKSPCSSWQSHKCHGNRHANRTFQSRRWNSKRDRAELRESPGTRTKCG
jgi:hypothetical protein